jgi:glutathione peroxidase
MTRFRFLAALALGGGVTLAPLPAMAETPAAPLPSIALKDIDGQETSLKAYDGKVLLVVNVASRCGYTRQYAGLQKLQESFAAKGFSVLGFPSNDFGGQEPGTETEIKEFCSTTYNVTFPLFQKVKVKGTDQHPFFAALTGTVSPLPGDVKWNFSKFLIGKDGTLLKRWDSGTDPGSPEITAAIEAALAAK